MKTYHNAIQFLCGWTVVDAFRHDVTKTLVGIAVSCAMALLLHWRHSRSKQHNEQP